MAMRRLPGIHADFRLASGTGENEFLARISEVEGCEACFGANAAVTTGSCGIGELRTGKVEGVGYGIAVAGTCESDELCGRR